VSSKDCIRNLYEYNEWANNLVLKAASALGEGQLRQETAVSMGSALANLSHIVRAQMGWLGFWRTGERQPVPEPPDEGAPEWLRESYARSHDDLRRFVETLTEEELGRMLERSDREGKTHRWRLWQLMVHVANHGTQHRAETAVALTALGSSPGDLDYGFFCDVRGSEASGTLEMMRTLYAYNEWANKRVLEAAAGLSDEEMLRPQGVSHGSPGMNMLHQLGGQVGWLSTWQEGAPWVPLPASESGRFLDNLAEWYPRSDGAIREFVDSLREEDLGEPRVDRMPGGKERTMMLWDMMVHVVNHGTQHRSESAMALTSVGRSPGDLDFLDFVDLRG
jgi:uncharacterized damage-inducible protein DinB